jgi:hypothetical protein
MKRQFSELWLISVIVLAGGCSDARTDTGYQPKRLNMSGNQIHGLYAPAFSPEAMEAKADKKATDVPIHPGGAGFSY